MKKNLKEEAREEWRIRYTEDFQGTNVSMVEMMSRVDSIIDRIVERCIEALPQEVEVGEPDSSMPEDPGMAADQARNYTIRQVRNSLQDLKETL